MARRARDTYAGFFHVWSHAVWSSVLYRDDLDRVRFVGELARTTEESGWRCIAMCLLTTHYHLVLEVEDDALPAGMKELNFRYAVGYNARHRQRGHVFGGRFGSRRIESDEDLKGAYRYVARNPIHAGLCHLPQLWPWSTYASAIGLREPLSFVEPSPVLGCFGASSEVAIAELRRFVETPDEALLRVAA